MADQIDFKHITVNPAEEDDIVIHAGAPANAEKPEGQGHRDAAGEAEDAAGEDAAAAADASPDAGPSVQSRPAAPKSNKAPDTAPKPDSYRQTTLEDIQGFKMSKTQIAVIVVALAAIAAFVVWYLVFS